MRGRLITLEGGEGTGKSTQTQRLAERLRGLGHDVLVTREPGGTPLGEQIRALILASRPSLDTEFLLFAASRAEHVAKAIRPALEAGTWVICDRYIDSTRVYQGRLAGVDPILLETVERHVSAGAWPNLTLVLDLAPEIGRARAQARGALNRYDAEHISYHDEIRQGFLEIAHGEPDRCAIVDAAPDSTAVAEAIWSVVACRLLATTS